MVLPLFKKWGSGDSVLAADSELIMDGNGAFVVVSSSSYRFFRLVGRGGNTVVQYLNVWFRFENRSPASWKG